MDELIKILKDMELQFQGIEDRIKLIKNEMKIMKETIKKIKEMQTLKEIPLNWNLENLKRLQKEDSNKPR